jgi:hypothetical protein
VNRFEDMACATCGRILNTYQRPDGGIARLHTTRSRSYDHRPVPGDQLTSVAGNCVCLGIHITTAVGWAHELKRDWTSYLATRQEPGNLG